MSANRGAITIGDAYSARFFGFFAWYVRGMLRRSFHAVRMVRGGDDELRGHASHERPVIMALSHASWWDPLLCVYLHQRFSPARRALGPIHARELSKFRFMRKLGLFGVDPDDPASFDPMVEHSTARMNDAPGTNFWITPQGRLVDVRTPIELRPGAAAVAARLCAGAGCRVVCVALEYAFWVDKRPEVFLRVEPCVAETPTSMTSWHRSLTRAMQRNGAALAELVAARDPSAFTCLEGGEAPRIHPVYDALLALRGQRRALDERGDGRETREPRP